MKLAEELRRLAVPVSLSFLLAALSLLCFGWLASEVVEGDTRAMDDAIRSSIPALGSPALTAFMRAVSFLGSSLFTGALAIVSACMLWNRSRRHAELLAGSVLVASALTNVLKHVFQRARPEPFFDTPLPGSYSFPSGHTVFATCIYLTIAMVLTKNRIIRAGAFVLVLAIGFSRIYLGVHYPSDVAGGFLAGLFWVFGLRIFLKRQTSVPAESQT